MTPLELAVLLLSQCCPGRDREQLPNKQLSGCEFSAWPDKARCEGWLGGNNSLTFNVLLMGESETPKASSWSEILSRDPPCCLTAAEGPDICFCGKFCLVRSSSSTVAALAPAKSFAFRCQGNRLSGIQDAGVGGPHQGLKWTKAKKIPESM